jgi:hypothetical protein
LIFSMNTPSDASPVEPAPTRDAVVRDDSGDLAALLDLHRERRRSGGRVKLIDTGKLAVPDLERLAEAGLEIFTSDAVRTDPHGLILVALAARKGGAGAAFFVHGQFRDPGDPAGISFEAVLELARTGMRVAVSNGRIPRDMSALVRLADACRKGGTRLIYYHTGPPEASLAGLCRAGAWLHLEAPALGPDDAQLAVECAGAALAAGGGLVLHVPEAIDPDAFTDLHGSGAFVLFHTPPSDYRDPRRELEARAARRRLPPEAAYLFSGFML